MRENTTLPVTTLIDPQVREHLVSSDRVGLGNGKFFKLSRTDLYGLMQTQFRPSDKLDFMKQLEDNVEFNFSTHFRPTPEYFKPFYDALQLYISKFSKLYEILTHGASQPALVIPRCDNKPGGLIKAFVLKIPYEYGTRVLQLMTTERWTDLYAFFKDFNQIADAHKLDGEAARKLRRCFGGTAYESKKFEQKLQHLQELRQVPDDLHDEHFADAMVAEAEELDEELDTMLAAAMQQPRGKGPFGKPPFDKNAPPRDPLVCLSKLLHGVCSKPMGTCNYSHKEDLIHKRRLEFIDLIHKQLSAAKSSAATQRVQKIVPLEDSYEDEEY